MKKELLVIKLGGSVITDKTKPFTALPKNILNLSRQIKGRLKYYKGDLVIIHGSGSFGHTLASKYKTQEGIVDKNSIRGFCEVGDTAIEINRIVMKELLKSGLNVVSFSPANIIRTENGNLKKAFTDNFKQALKMNIVPVLYGDVVFDEKRGFTIFSGEKIIHVLLRKISKEYSKITIIFCTDTNGIYDNNGKTINHINSKNSHKIIDQISDLKVKDVTGGMLHKVNQSLILSKKYKARIYIVNGKKDDLNKILRGKKTESTLILNY